jgi:hypothetical protein
VRGVCEQGLLKNNVASDGIVAVKSGLDLCFASETRPERFVRLVSELSPVRIKSPIVTHHDCGEVLARRLGKEGLLFGGDNCQWHSSCFSSWQSNTLRFAQQQQQL